MPTPAQGSRSAGGEVSNVESSRENDSDSGQEQSSSSDLELSDSDMYTDSDSEGLHDFSSLRTVQVMKRSNECHNGLKNV